MSLPVTSLGATAGESLAHSASGLPPRPRRRQVRDGHRDHHAGRRAEGRRDVPVTVSVKDGAGATATVAFSWRVSPA
ncbi:MAG TPA: hypothetical protein VGG54_28695 [Trebonia sp.]